MKKLILAVIIFSFYSVQSQNFSKVMISRTDPEDLYVNDNDLRELFYLKFVPKKTTIKGVLVILPSGGEKVENTLKQINLHKLALRKDLLIIIPSINWNTED